MRESAEATVSRIPGLADRVPWSKRKRERKDSCRGKISRGPYGWKVKGGMSSSWRGRW